MIDAYRFPSSVRQRFALAYGSLIAAEITTVEDATRQWFRLAARHPKARLAMPSVIVDSLWHEFVLHTRDYAEFCDTALGHFLHHVPEPAMSPTGAATLRDTLKLAQQDESIAATALPLLFRVDRDLAVEGGRRYLADCGGRGECYGAKEAVCLQHLTGAGRKSHGGWKDRDQPPIDPGMAGAGGCVGAGF
jgi:hypothetical protein